MKSIKIWACSAIIALCGVTNVQAQVMKSADLEKYAKQRYGERWLDAALTIAEELTLDKNQSLTYQEIIEVPLSFQELR